MSEPTWEWLPTLKLRFLEQPPIFVPMLGRPDTGTSVQQPPILQQLWHHRSNGTTEWRNIPVVPAEEDKKTMRNQTVTA